MHSLFLLLVVCDQRVYTILSFQMLIYITRNLLLVAAVACTVVADYWQVSEESCLVLKSPDSLFTELIDNCAVFKSLGSDDLYCFPPEYVDFAAQQAPFWTLTNTTEGPTLYRSFEFSDFRSAFYFMAEGAQLADKNEHHPNWSNLYNTVDVIWATDDKGCLSNFDVFMAQSMNLLYDTMPVETKKVTK